MIQGKETAVANLLDRIGRLVSRNDRAEGLPPVQWEVLRYLARANRFSRTASAVTAYLGQTKGTVSQTLTTLQTKGLIRKQEDRKDRRSKQLVVSAKGKRTLAKDPLLEVTGAIGELPKNSSQELATGLEALLMGMLEARGRQPFGQCNKCVHFARDHADGAPYYCQLLDESLSDKDSVKICAEQTTSPAVL